MDNFSSEIIESITQKINLIAEENNALKKQLTFYENEVATQKNIIHSERENIKKLENQIKIDNIAKGNVEGGENVRVMKAKINEVIREVDKCIRYLKN